MGFLLSLQNLDQRETENRDLPFASSLSAGICLSTASMTVC